MIDKASFLGVSLTTQRRRRSLVVAYYTLLLLLLALALYQPRFVTGALVCQTLTIGGLLGGIQIGGPVKPYAGSRNADTVPSGIQELNLSGRRSLAAFKPLDEREALERDHAHYVAYRIIRFSIFPLALLFLFFMDMQPRFLARNSVSILWFLAVWILSLPQSVILWTEPEPLVDAELGLVEAVR